MGPTLRTKFINAVSDMCEHFTPLGPEIHDAAGVKRRASASSIKKIKRKKKEATQRGWENLVPRIYSISENLALRARSEFSGFAI